MIIAVVRHSTTTKNLISDGESLARPIIACIWRDTVDIMMGYDELSHYDVNEIIKLFLFGVVATLNDSS